MYYGIGSHLTSNNSEILTPVEPWMLSSFPLFESASYMTHDPLLSALECHQSHEASMMSYAKSE